MNLLSKHKLITQKAGNIVPKSRKGTKKQGYLAV